MKIAVLSSGQLRSFNEKRVYSSLVENILVPLKEQNSKNQIRLFFNIGVTETEDTLEEEIKMSEDAIQMIKNSGTLDDLEIKILKYSSKITPERRYPHFHQLYGIQKGFEYIMDTWEPDVLIRTRPDFMGVTPFKISNNLNDHQLFCLVKSDTQHRAHDCFFYMSKTFYENVWKEKALNHLERECNVYIGTLENCFVNKVFNSEQLSIIEHSEFKGGLKREGENGDVSIWD